MPTCLHFRAASLFDLSDKVGSLHSGVTDRRHDEDDRDCAPFRSVARYTSDVRGICMFQAFVDGFLLVFEWRVFAFMLLGVAIGIWLGAIPGLGGITGLVLLIPFTFGMDPAPAFAMLLGMQAVIHTSDTIPAVVMGVPGTAAAQATVLDGFPLAQRGEGGRALGAAFTASAIGGVVGALSLAICLPLIKPIILSVGNPEKFALGVLGLALVGSLAGASILKGLAIAAFGLLLSTIGYAPSAPVPRFWFGIDYLIVELPLIPVVLGIFALAEVIDLALRNTSISRTAKSAVIGGDMLTGIKDALSHWWLILRCSAIGAYIGLLPGLGAAISDWVAYGHAVQSAKDRSQFGKGDIRGVIGPEAANNATLGGDLVPTVAFALPGSASMAIMLTVMLVHGLVPGQAMLTTNAHLTFSMVWTVAIANVIGAGLLMIWARQVAKVAFIPGQLVVPGVIVFLFMGAWFANASLGDWLTCLVFGILGFFMKRGGWPRPPLVLALVLGNIMENAFVISTRAYEGWLWLTRPMFLVIMALVVLTLFVSARGYLKNRGAQADEAGEGNARNPLISLPIAILLFVAFVAAVLRPRLGQDRQDLSADGGDPRRRPGRIADLLGGAGAACPDGAARRHRIRGAGDRRTDPALAGAAVPGLSARTGPSDDDPRAQDRDTDLRRPLRHPLGRLQLARRRALFCCSLGFSDRFLRQDPARLLVPIRPLPPAHGQPAGLVPALAGDLSYLASRQGSEGTLGHIRINSKARMPEIIGSAALATSLSAANRHP